MNEGGEAFSVIIPAHNEAGVIARCLEGIRKDAPAGAMEIIVVCNGCTDDTAVRARAVSPDIRVIELDKGSKPLALNTGLAAASYPIRLFVDADLAVDHGSLRAVADVLRRPGVMAASPAMAVDLSRSSALVRAFYRVWMDLPYVRERKVGSAVFGLSPEGLAVLGEFPPIIADDEYVRTRFSAAQLCLLREDANGRPVRYTVFPPRDVPSLIRTESRQRAGLHDLRRLYPSPETTERLTDGSVLTDALRRGASPLDLAVYVAIKLIGRLHFRWSLLRRREQRWLRDDSSRHTA